MLVELSVMEQRYQAVVAVIRDGWKVPKSPNTSASHARASTTGSPAAKPTGRTG